MADRLKVGIIGATGMVGQRFVSLLAEHPWFQVTTVAARGSRTPTRSAADGPCRHPYPRQSRSWS
jgi:aspartate-semialdehyde dehydrogenase